MSDGGTERVFLSIADYLSKTHGWSIDFVIDKISGQETEQTIISKDFRVIALDVQRSWKTILPFLRYLRNECPDVVISAYTETNAAALLSSALNGFRIPVIVTEHAPLDEHWKNKPWIRRMMLELIVRYVYRFSDCVMGVSHGMAQQIRTRLKHHRVCYSHNPVRFTERTKSKMVARRYLGFDDGRQIILAVGRISQPKNYLMLLEALLHVDASTPYCLYIVGGIFELEEKSRLDNFVNHNGLDGKVVFIGFTHDIKTYYEASDLLVSSSAWEGFGNVIAEALSFGLPVVSSNCNYGPSEILLNGQCGVLVDVNDSVAMGSAIQRVLKNNPFDPVRQILRANDFSEKNIGGNYHNIICEVKLSRQNKISAVL